MQYPLLQYPPAFAEPPPPLPRIFDWCRGGLGRGDRGVLGLSSDEVSHHGVLHIEILFSVNEFGVTLFFPK